MTPNIIKEKSKSPTSTSFIIQNVGNKKNIPSVVKTLTDNEIMKEFNGNSYLTPKKTKNNSNTKILNNTYNESNIKFNKLKPDKLLNLSSTDYKFKQNKNKKENIENPSLLNTVIENQRAQNLIKRKKNLGNKIKKLVGNKKNILINNKKIVLSVPKKLRLNRKITNKNKESKINKKNKIIKKYNSSNNVVNLKKIPSNKLSYYKKKTNSKNKYDFYDNNYNKVNNVKLKNGEIIKLDSLDRKGQLKVSKRLKKIDNSLVSKKLISNKKIKSSKRLKKNSYLYHKFPTTPLKNVVKKVTIKVKNKKIVNDKKIKKTKSNFNSFMNFFKFGK